MIDLLSNWASIESYKEGKKSTFSHNDKHYSIDKILKLTEDIKPTSLSIKELVHTVPDYMDSNDHKRVSEANTIFPLLVYKKRGKYWVVNGLHRLKKLHNNGAKSIIVIIVPMSIMDKAELTQDEYDKIWK